MSRAARYLQAQVNSGHLTQEDKAAAIHDHLDEEVEDTPLVFKAALSDEGDGGGVVPLGGRGRRVRTLSNADSGDDDNGPAEDLCDDEGTSEEETEEELTDEEVEIVPPEDAPSNLWDGPRGDHPGRGSEAEAQLSL